MRPINADALIQWLDVGHLRSPSELCYSELDVKHIIDAAPTLDVQPIVRCKDCVLRGDVRKCPICYEIEYTWDDDGWDETTWEIVDRTQDNGFCHVGSNDYEID